MTKKLDLRVLAREIEVDYKEVKLILLGQEYSVKVYHFSTVESWKYKPDRPEPIMPVVVMKTVTGSQDRLIKKGDKGYKQWIIDSQSYQDETAEIQQAARYVLSLRDMPYPEDLSISPENNNGTVYPENDMLRKMYWLNHTFFMSSDNMTLVAEAIQELQTNGNPNPDDIENIKKNSESD